MRLSNPLTGLSALLILSSFDAGCGDAGTPVVPLEPALEAAVDLIIVPSMERFATEASALESRSNEFCASPSVAALTAARDQWLVLAPAWNEAMVYFLGPLDDDPITPSIALVESMRPRGTEYTDAVRMQLDAALQSTEVFDDTFFDSLNFNRVGLLAMEVLLFEDTSRTDSTEAADVVAGYEEEPRKCEYLEGMASLLARRAEVVRAGWTEDFDGSGISFRDRMLAGTVLDDGFLPVPALVRASARHVEYLRDRKLDGILDAQLAGAARPDPTPFYENLDAGLDSLEAMLDPPGSDDGFFQVMTERGFQELVDTVRQNLESARAAVDAEDREAATVAFIVLEDSIRREVVIGLGIDLGIGFLDGD